MTNSKNNFGNRMKMYEKLNQQHFIPMLPICIRLDGRCFSKWTKKLTRPYSISMMNIMRNITIRLVKETNAVIGYTQSDEISIILHSDSVDSQVYFNGKIQKIISSTAAFVSAYFNESVQHNFNLNACCDGVATFDCRAWQVPNKIEAVNTLLWREQDATKNSISMAARSVYSHKELINCNSVQMQDMLMKKSINWNDYPAQFKRGVFIQRKKTVRKYHMYEIAELPEKHEARINPDLHVQRTDIVAVDMPPFTKVINKIGVVFNGEEPLVCT